LLPIICEQAGMPLLYDFGYLDNQGPAMAWRIPDFWEDRHLIGQGHLI
jgi:hypothetical protein